MKYSPVMNPSTDTQDHGEDMIVSARGKEKYFLFKLKRKFLSHDTFWVLSILLWVITEHLRLLNSRSNGQRPVNSERILQSWMINVRVAGSTFFLTLIDIGNSVVSRSPYIQVRPKTALARFDLRFRRMDREWRLTYNVQHSTLITCSSLVSYFQRCTLAGDVAVAPTSDSNETPHRCVLVRKSEQPKSFPRPKYSTTYSSHLLNICFLLQLASVQYD